MGSSPRLEISTEATDPVELSDRQFSDHVDELGARSWNDRHGIGPDACKEIRTDLRKPARERSGHAIKEAQARGAIVLVTDPDYNTSRPIGVQLNRLGMKESVLERQAEYMAESGTSPHAVLLGHGNGIATRTVIDARLRTVAFADRLMIDPAQGDQMMTAPTRRRRDLREAIDRLMQIIVFRLNLESDQALLEKLKRSMNTWKEIFPNACDILRGGEIYFSHGSEVTLADHETMNSPVLRELIRLFSTVNERTSRSKCSEWFGADFFNPDRDLDSEIQGSLDGVICDDYATLTGTDANPAHSALLGSPGAIIIDRRNLSHTGQDTRRAFLTAYAPRAGIIMTDLTRETGKGDNNCQLRIVEAAAEEIGNSADIRVVVGPGQKVTSIVTRAGSTAHPVSGLPMNQLESEVGPHHWLTTLDDVGSLHGYRHFQEPDTYLIEAFLASLQQPLTPYRLNKFFNHIRAETSSLGHVWQAARDVFISLRRRNRTPETSARTGIQLFIERNAIASVLSNDTR